jgi:hypothetical protein
MGKGNSVFLKIIVFACILGFLSQSGCALFNMELREYWRQIKLVDLQALSAMKELQQYFEAIKSGKSTGLLVTPRETIDKLIKIKKDLLAIKSPAETKNHHRMYVTLLDTTIDLLKETDAIMKLLPMARSASVAYELRTKHLPKFNDLLAKMEKQGKELDAERVKLHAASYGLTPVESSSGFPK